MLIPTSDTPIVTAVGDAGHLDLPGDSVDLVFCSPPYEAKRRYTELDWTLKGEAWVEWAVATFREHLRVCRGLVVWVVDGSTEKFRYSATPERMIAELHRSGANVRRPVYYHRHGIPGSGGPDAAGRPLPPDRDGVRAGQLPPTQRQGAARRRRSRGDRRGCGMRVFELFAGVGGLSLGLERAGMTTVGLCETDPFCRDVLARRFPGVPLYDDVTTLNPAAVGAVDVIAGGFPCQDISVAGKGAGIDGKRSGLWKEMHRVIESVRPRWVIAENVPDLRTRGADRVLGDLEAIGYACWPLVVGADDIGAPHRRKRVFIVAHQRGERLEGEQQAGPTAGSVGRGRRTIVAHAEREHRERWGVAGLMGTAPQEMCPNPAERQWNRPTADGRVGEFPPRPGDCARWRMVLGIRPDLAPACPVEPAICGLADGVPDRLVRRARKHALRAYGNAVVPAVAELIGRAVLAVDREIEGGAA